MASMASVEPTNIEIADICFKKTEDASLWICKLCEKEKSCDRGRAGTGNLISHLKIVHKDEYLKFVQEVKGGLKKPMVQTKMNVVDKKNQNIYGWMDLMTDRDVPFCWAEQEGFLKNIKLEKVDHKTLKKYFAEMGFRVEQNFVSNYYF
jgi:hypothetical protein